MQDSARRGWDAIRRHGVIALVDCYAHRQLFVSDEEFRALAQRLREAGVQVELFDVVRAAPESGMSVSEVCAALSDLLPAVVVMSRAWNAELVGELRAAVRDAMFIRYSHGAPSAIDAMFDAVMDPRGLQQFVLAGVASGAPAIRRTKEELRQKEASSSSATGALATISGPARGCPFLVDVRQSPAYRDLDLELDSVQTKGCAFCLDNLGAYAGHSEEEIVTAWLSQWAALRADRPELREVLLTDERPHPVLPAFFRGILERPELHGIELLIKTRVDWLAEFADSALVESCALAERSGSILHIYLVGFESFHQPDLDLFNKAVSVADNVRAIELLRTLETRFPQSFEFRRHRAHGIVLFHPWTTPESLLENAQVMREVRFHELRSQALRTRLRLYASVPLHVLAVRDGLLAETFEQGRGDRAVEQGYDASLPWRFADPKVEAIFRASNRLAEILPQLAEADILEMTTRFILRWPCFADCPDLAVYPLLYSIFSWGSSPSDLLSVVGPIVAQYDREVGPVVDGPKPACLKEGIAREHGTPLLEAYGRMGLCAAIVSEHDRGGDDGIHGRGHSHVCVAVAADQETLQRVLQQQRLVETGERRSIHDMGVLMGYPSCCIEAFATLETHGKNLALERVPFQRHPELPLDARLSRFSAVSLLSHFLCSPDCEASIQIAENRLTVLRGMDEVAEARIRRHLATPVLRLDYRRAALLQGRWEGDQFHVDTFQPFNDTDLGVEATDVRRIRLFEDRVRLELRSGHPHEITGVAPILVEPGRALAPAVRAVLNSSYVARTDVTSSPSSPSHGGDVESFTGLVPRIVPGQRVGDFTIEEVGVTQGEELSVSLVRGVERAVLRVSRWKPGVNPAARRGRWALDTVHGGAPSGLEQAALTALSLALPAGSRVHHDGGVPSGTGRTVSSGKLADVGVVCTAPWTTLEVVDPDGLARQCCSDWTIGHRGNLHHNSLAEIWNGESYREARRVMSSGSLGSLCRVICPRLYDKKFAESEFTIMPGASRFVENQRLLKEDIAQRRDIVRGRPLYIAVCPSTYCNYDCIMCMHGRSPRRDLPEAIWDELLAFLPTLRVLTLLGGEPLANPTAMHFLKQWDRSRYPDAVVSLVTNGSLLTPKVLRGLDRCSFGSVTVSLNAGTAPVYAAVQRGVEFAGVLENVDALIEFRQRQGSSFPIVLSFVVQPANHFTLLEFAEIARQRQLPIRLMPLNPHGPDGLDFYSDRDQVERILASLDRMDAWAARLAPSYRAEIRGTRSAIEKEASARAGQTIAS